MEKVKNYFDNFPGSDVCHMTSDGFIFPEKHNADAYADTLKDKRVKTYSRAAVEAAFKLSEKETTGSETETAGSETSTTSETKTDASETETAGSETSTTSETTTVTSEVVNEASETPTPSETKTTTSEKKQPAKDAKTTASKGKGKTNSAKG